MSEKNLKLIIVDDHTLFRCGLTLLIKSACFKCQILEAQDGHTLNKMLSKTDSDTDIVLLDTNIPESDVYLTIQTARCLIPTIKIIALIETFNEATAARLIQKGVNAVLLKSAEVSEVTKALRGVLQKGYYFGSESPEIDFRKFFSNKGIEHNSQFDFSDRELQIIRLIMEEKTTEEIGQILRISPRTVDGYRKKILLKTCSKNSVGIVMYALKNHLVHI